jgi:hypothetical protein
MLRASQLLYIYIYIYIYIYSYYIYTYTVIIYIYIYTHTHTHTHIFPVGKLFSSCVEEWDTVSPYYSIIVGYVFMLVSAASCGFYQLCTLCVVGYLL